MTAAIASMTFFLLLYAGAAALYAVVEQRRRPVDARLSDIAIKIKLADSVGRGESENRDGLGRMLLNWARDRMPASAVDSVRSEKLSETLVQAGYKPGSLPNFHLARLALAVGGGLTGAVLAWWFHVLPAQAFVLVSAGAMVGILGPTYSLKRQARRRQIAIARQLSDALDLLVVCIEAGLGLHEAIKTVGGESQRQGRVIGDELLRVSGDMQAGGTLGSALRALAERTAVEDIKPLAAMLIQSEQLGTQLGPALRASSDALRARRRLRAEEAAQKTSVKILIPLVLLVVPSMMLVVIGPAFVQIMRAFHT
jgi:tight adherence protein C